MIRTVVRYTVQQVTVPVTRRYNGSILKLPVTTVSLARSIVVFARTAFQRQRPCGMSQWHQPGHAAPEISLRTAVCAKMVIGPQARCAECRWLRWSSGPGAICRAIRGRFWESVLHSQSAAFSPLSPGSIDKTGRRQLREQQHPEKSSSMSPKKPLTRVRRNPDVGVHKTQQVLHCGSRDLGPVA